MGNAIPAPPRMTAIDGGVQDGIEWATVTAPLYGAVNGYVRIPEDHPWFGKDCDDEVFWDLDVNGGLTYGQSAEGWIGFDTLHLGDWWTGMPGFMREHGAHPWTAAEVAEHTRNLARQIAAAVTR